MFGSSTRDAWASLSDGPPRCPSCHASRTRITDEVAALLGRQRPERLIVARGDGRRVAIDRAEPAALPASVGPQMSDHAESQVGTWTPLVT